jgi:hypothetical protein
MAYNIIKGGFLMLTKDIREILRSANASVEMEGQKPSQFALDLARDHLEGKISKSDVTKMIVERYVQP